MSSKKRTLLSIGIAAYNSEKTIEACLRSILSQSSSDVEVVFIDDNSSDKTFTLAKSILCSSGISYSCTKHTRNLGVAITRREIIENSNGDYLAWLDSDDVICDGSLELILRNICASNKPTAFIYNAIIKNKNKAKLLYKYKTHYLDSNLAKNYIATDTLFKAYPWTTVVPTKLIPRIVLPTNPTDYVDDQLIVYSFFSNVQATKYISNPICLHTIYESSDSHSSLFFMRLSRTFDYIYKQSIENNSLIENNRKIEFLKAFYYSIYISSSQIANSKTIVKKESQLQRKKRNIKKILCRASLKTKIEYLTFIYLPTLFYLHYRGKKR